MKKDIKKIKKIVKILIFIAIISVFIVILSYFFKPFILSFGQKLLEIKYTSSKVIDVLKPLDYYAKRVPLAYSGILNSFIIFSLLSILTIFLLIPFVKNRIDTKHFKIGIILIILADLFYFGLPYIDVKDPSEIFARNDIVRFLEKDKSHYRVLDLTVEKAVPQQIAVRYGIQKVLGYDVVILKYYNEYLATMGGFKPGPGTTIPLKNIIYPKMLDLLNAKYIITDKKLEANKNYKLVYDTDYNIYLNKNFLPRSFIIQKAVIKDTKEILEEMKKQDFNPREYIILEKQFNKNLNGDSSFKEAQITYYSPNKIVVEVFLDKPGFLVLSENWYPGWKAYDNGKETEVYRTDYLLRSVYLEKGMHKVTFIYNPLSYKIGVLTTLITLLVIIIYLINSKTRILIKKIKT